MAAKHNKTVANQPYERKKQVVAQTRYSTDSMVVAWCFDRIDRNGKFAFDINRSDFDAQKIMDKIISYGSMSWNSVKKQTHDKKAKSKHHYLSVSGLSPEAYDRALLLVRDEDMDSIFSFAFTNTLRIIGIRENEKFHVIWYDPYHEFYPSTL